MPLNNFEGSSQEQLGDLISSMNDRINRLELQDRLTRVHPITGSDDFLGTVISTPGGEPVFIVSEDKGLELPGMSGVISRPNIGSEGYVLSSVSSGVATNVWEVRFVGVLSDAVEIEHNILVNRIDGGLTDVGVWLQPFTINSSGNTVLQTPSSIETISSGFWVTGIFRWAHGLEIDPAQLWGVRVMVEVSNDSEVTTDRPGFAMQRSSDVMDNYDAGSPFQPWSAGSTL